MAKGTVKWFNRPRDTGSVTPRRRQDVFVHISAVERAGLSNLNEGRSSQYEVVSNRGKDRAGDLRSSDLLGVFRFDARSRPASIFLLRPPAARGTSSRLFVFACATRGDDDEGNARDTVIRIGKRAETMAHCPGPIGSISRIGTAARVCSPAPKPASIIFSFACLRRRRARQCDPHKYVYRRRPAVPVSTFSRPNARSSANRSYAAVDRGHGTSTASSLPVASRSPAPRIPCSAGQGCRARGGAATVRAGSFCPRSDISRSSALRATAARH